MKAKITQQQANALQTTGAKYTIHDDGRGSIPGFHLRVGAKGDAVFYLSYRNRDGDRRNYRIGRVADWTVGAARTEAERLRGIIRTGGDPHTEKVQDRREQAASETRTVKAFIDGLYADLVISQMKTGKQVLVRLNRIASEMGILNLDLMDVTVRDVEQWRAGRRAAGITPPTLNRDITTIRSMVKSAVRLGVIEENPLADLRNLRDDSDHRVRYLTSGERERLYEVLEPRRDYMKPLVHLLLNTGLRKTEALSLQWSDINLEQKTLTVRAATAKSGKTRHIPLNQRAIVHLLEWLGNRKRKGWVFPSPATGGRMVSIATAWAKVLDAAAVHDFRIHDCRHDFCSQLVMKGVDLSTVRDLAGHASVLMTERYAHLAPEHKRSAVEVLDD